MGMINVHADIIKDIQGTISFYEIENKVYTATNKFHDLALVLNTLDPYQGKSYMIEALNACLKILFDRAPNLLIENRVDKTNIQSQTFHKKFGFEEMPSFPWDTKLQYIITKKSFESTAQERKERIEKAYEKGNQPTVNEYEKSSIIFHSKQI